MAVVWIPSLMQRMTGGQDKVRVSGATLRQVINHLEDLHPGIKERLVDDEGRFQEGVAIAIDGEVTNLGLLERVGEDSEIHIIPAIGGG